MNVEAALAEQGRAAGRAPPHRAARATTRSRPTCGCGPGGPIDELDGGLRRVRARARRARRARRRRRSCPARPTSSRHSPCCSPITCSPTSRWPERDRGRLARRRAGGSTSRRSAPGALAGAGYPLDRDADRGRARLRWRHRELARRGLGSRLRRRDPGGRGARDGPSQPAGRGDHLVGEPSVRVRPRRRRLFRPAAR